MDQRQTNDDKIVIEKIIETKVSKAFNAWTKTSELEQWWGSKGSSIVTHEMNFRSGGIWRFSLFDSERNESKNRIKYKDIVSLEKIVFTNDFDIDDNPNEYESIILFNEENGKTKVTLMGVFPSKEVKDSVLSTPNAIKGINETISRLTKYLEDTYKKSEIITAKAKIRIRKNPSEVFTAFANADKMSKFWFTRRDEGLEAGKVVSWFTSNDKDAISFDVRVKEVSYPDKIVIEWAHEEGKYTQVMWSFEELQNGETILTIEESGFTGSNEEIIKRALDSTGGFNQVIVAAKALIEHGIEVNVVADHP